MKHAYKRSIARFAVLTAMALPLAAQPFSDILQGTSHPPIRILPTPDTGTPTGIFPGKMRVAYGFSNIHAYGGGQTIAIVDAYDDPNAEADLGTFDTQFGLPACTTANGCFTKIYATGTRPRTDSGWALEISLDVQWAHAIAPGAKIMLVEAASNSNAALYHAVDVAVQNGAKVVSMSWGGGEASNEVSSDSHFSVAGVTFVTSSGDGGHGAQYPAASPQVVSVGGTSLTVGSNGAYVSETAWSGSGGGLSAYETEPSYQAGVETTGKRGIPDVAYDADPATGVPVYDTVGEPGWVQVGGTSMGAPQIAAMFAIANGARVASGKATLNQPQFIFYPLPGDFHDITSGTNGTCGALCTAGPGYDYVTGLGTPRGALLIQALVTAP